jgi:hypothetical protein
MAEPIILCVAIMVVLAIAAMGRGFVSLLRSRGSGSAATADEARVEAEMARERALTDLRDLEMEHALRKLNDKDYEELRNRAEGDAYLALRNLRNLAKDPEGSPPVGVILALAFAGLLSSSGAIEAQSLPAGHPPIAGAPAAPAASSRAPIQLHAVHIAPNGLTTPLAGDRVVVSVDKRRPGRREVFDSVSEEVVILDQHGRALLKDQTVPAGGRAMASLIYEGTRFVGLADAQGRIRIDAHDTDTSLSELSVRLHVALSVDEARVWVQTDLVFRNPTGRVIDLSQREAPLALPLLGPVIGGQVLTAGWMPPQARRHMRLRTTPDRGRLDLVDGALTYEGLILPGVNTQLQVRYPLDIDRARMALGIRYDTLPIEDLLVTLESGSRIEPEVVLSRPSAGQGSAEVGGTTRVAWLAAPLPAGESVELTLLRLPAPPRVVGRMVIFSLALGALALGVGLLRARALARIRRV